MVGNPKRVSIHGGFIIEALTAVSGVAVLAGGHFMLVANGRCGLRKQKLAKDVSKVNSVTQLYPANGESLEGKTGSFSSS